jgi:hypothetical protein
MKFVLRALFVEDAAKGCSGVVLEAKGHRIVVFRSATEVSTFLKVGASSLAQTPVEFAPGVTCNRYLAETYDKHISAPLAALVQESPEMPTTFLGYSMGAALSQLALFDLVIKRELSIATTHLLLASPRIASQSFYTELQKQGVWISNIIAATRYCGAIHMDPVPLIKGFSDPPRILLLGRLYRDISWHESVCPSDKTRLTLTLCSVLFRDSFACHALQILGSYMQTALGESSMDLHASYSMLVSNCVVK